PRGRSPAPGTGAAPSAHGRSENRPPVLSGLSASPRRLPPVGRRPGPGCPRGWTPGRAAGFSDRGRFGAGTGASRRWTGGEGDVAAPPVSDGHYFRARARIGAQEIRLAPVKCASK